MGVEWVAGLLVFFSVACLGGAAFLFFREAWLIQWLRGTAGFLLVGFALYASLVAASLFGYQQVSTSVPMATISFAKAGDRAWNVTLAEANGDRRVYEMLGDLWQLDVRLLRYHGVASVFGAAPSFQLDRLAGRYASLEDEATRDHTEYSLATEPFLGFDLWQRAFDHGSLVVDARRSNVTLVPMADGAIFELRLGDTGLGVMPANSAAEEALKRIGD